MLLVENVKYELCLITNELVEGFTLREASALSSLGLATMHRVRHYDVDSITIELLIKALFSLGVSVEVALPCECE